MVRTSPFHGGNTGSNPVGVTIFKTTFYMIAIFLNGASSSGKSSISKSIQEISQIPWLSFGVDNTNFQIK